MKGISCLACLILVLGSATRGFALGGELNEPELAFPEGFSESSRTCIRASLRRPGCKFLGGHFINSFTSLKYQGNTPALNLFLEGLVKCPGVVLSVRFQSDSFPDDCDWLVTHMAGEPGDLAVRVNLKSTRVSLEALVIPDVKGPPVPAEK